jgi:hypothetical protein
MTTRDLDRIRFVTRHFHDLQGLRYWVPLGLLTLSVGGTTYFENRPFVILRAAMAIGAVLLFLGARRYYRKAYGEVEWQPVLAPTEFFTLSVFSPAGPVQRLTGSQGVPPVARRFLTTMGAAFALFLILQAISPSFEVNTDESLVQRPWTTMKSWMIAWPVDGELWPMSLSTVKALFGQTLYTFFGSFFLGMWIWRERRLYQSHYLAFAILLLGLSMLGASLGAFYGSTGEIARLISLVEPFTIHLWVALVLCGSAMILAGLLDHWQLARTLGRQEK